MNDKYIWTIIVTAVLTIMLFFNRKVRLFALIKEQMLVFKNDKTKKLSITSAVMKSGENISIKIKRPI